LLLRQILRPCATRLTCRLYLKGGGTEACMSFWIASVSRRNSENPRRERIRRQCVSTGNTRRSSEYIITHLADFKPMPGRPVRKCSTPSSSCRLSLASLLRPPAWRIRSSSARICASFLRDRPPDAIVRATSPSRAETIANQSGNLALRAR